MNKSGGERYLDREFAAFQMRVSFKHLKPNARDRRTALDVIFPPYSQELLAAVDTGEDLVRSQLAALRERVRETGENPSRPQICARYILNGIVVPLQNLALDMYRQGGHEDFIFWHDVKFGVNYITSRIALAESSIRGNADLQATETISAVENRLKVTMPPSVQFQAYLREMQETTGTERLLKRDPSGFQLIDETIKQLRDPKQRTHDQRIIMESLVTDYVIAGAKLAQRVYQRIYPLTEIPIPGDNTL